MYSATVLLQITDFKTLDAGCTTAFIGKPNDISPPPPSNPPVFSGSGESITITVPKGYQGSVQLIYQLPDPRYVLLGVAFKNPNGGVGQLEFRSVSVSRDLTGSQMMVTDSCVHECYGIDYTYVILVQEVSSAKIGAIDPDVETQVTED